MSHALTPREKVALKPCPFCGGPEHHIFNDPDEYGRPSHGIQCANGTCWISGPQCETPEKAAEAWNRRTALASGSGDHAELARLADDLRKFEHHAAGSLKIDMTEVRRIIAACDAHATLLAENAALRAEWRAPALPNEAAACIREMVEWRPIETAPRDGTIIQRPHTTWGAMSVRHKRLDQSEEFLRGFSWMSADYSVVWPESAFLPFWLPLPPAPGADA